jgi:hypothetical protein
MSESIPVTVDNFVRAESDGYFGRITKDGGFGKFLHFRAPTPLDNQTVIRMNRDTLYSGAIFDLDAGAVSITLPDGGRRFVSAQIVSEDHYTLDVYYEPGTYTFTREEIGTRYMLVILRILANDNPTDLAEVNRLQDAVVVEQASSGVFEVPAWDADSHKKVRDALLALATTLPNLNNAFGTAEEVDPIRHLIASASAWGGNPDKEAIYLNVVPAQNDGNTLYSFTVGDVPVDGFWSISVYDADGYFALNAQKVNSINNLSATPNADGSITVQFGGCDGSAPNCIPITPGWNYLVRMYRPRAEILSGAWKFPEPVAVG